MNDIMFSVCIPVRNTYTYVVQCIESVLRQSYSNYEIIIVDNESDDGSEKIIDQYAEQYENISVIHQKNQGLLLSRRRAISEAKGDYLCFLDSDDYWAEDLLEKCYEEIKKDYCDMVSFSYYEVSQNGISVKKLYEKEGLLDCKKYLELVFENAILNNLWLKVARRDLFIDAENSQYEDFGILNKTEGGIQTIEILGKTKRVRVINSPLYYYRVQGQGITSSGQEEHLHELEKHYSCFVDSLLCNQMKNEQGYVLYQVQFMFNIFLIIVRICMCNERKDIIRNKIEVVCQTAIFNELATRNVLSQMKLTRSLVILLAKYRCYWLLMLICKNFGKI